MSEPLRYSNAVAVDAPSKVWLITGSARGLGRDIAAAALEAGDRVLATARDPKQLEDLVALYPDRIEPFALDVTDAVAARAAVEAAVERFGRLDVVVNNAGYANLVAIEDITMEDFRAQVETNLFGVVNVTKAALPVLREQGAGHIIQISSVGGRLASPGLAAYQTAKWAVGGFSEVLAKEVEPLGIKVTVLEPGGMSTDWGGASMSIPPISEPYASTVGRRAELMRDASYAGDPAKVAQVVLQLTGLDQPPLRLMTGTDAFTYATAAARSRAESDAQWRELSVSTDYDDATAEQLDPLAKT
jgi:NAD(P)-dependent dehydrogenase (short-subunit alcohol dehydrogenase family)